MKFLLPIFCCLIMNVLCASDEKHDPAMTSALQTLLPNYQKYPDITRLLVRKKANPSALLHAATEKDDRTTMAMVLQRDPSVVNHVDPITGRTPLQKAHSKQAANLLLHAQADAAVQQDGKTVVQVAVQERKPFALLHILCQQKDVDMNHKDPKDGNTAAHMLFLEKPLPSNTTDLAALLDLAGADFDVPNNEGNTAKDLIRAHCPRAQQRRIKTNFKHDETLQSKLSQEETAFIRTTVQALRSIFPGVLVAITTEYAYKGHLNASTWNAFLHHKHNLRMRG